MSVSETVQGPTPPGSGLETHSRATRSSVSLSERLDRAAGWAFIMPAVVVVLFLSIFPLIVSLYISLIRLQFVPGGLPSEMRVIAYLLLFSDTVQERISAYDAGFGRQAARQL